MGHWTLADIAWDRFDRAKVDPEVVRVIKAASLVEVNGDDYGLYLARVFTDDPEFKAAAEIWAIEEIQHGHALAGGVNLVEPEWDFAAAKRDFTAHFRVKVDATESIRGSRTGELIARCIVECGTSSYYSALADPVGEPVLKQICRNIAADEFRHYKLFYDHMRRYQTRERLGRWGRMRVGLGRIRESEGDELAMAYHFANRDPGPYRRRDAIKAYMRRAYPLYRHDHIWRMTGMVMKAIGVKANGRLRDVVAGAASWFIARRAARLARLGV